MDWTIKLSGGILQVWLDNNNANQNKGFIFYGYICAVGYYINSVTSNCVSCSLIHMSCI